MYLITNARNTLAVEIEAVETAGLMKGSFRAPRRSFDVARVCWPRKTDPLSNCVYSLGNK
jgi:hypothetical protein